MIKKAGWMLAIGFVCGLMPLVGLAQEGPRFHVSAPAHVQTNQTFTVEIGADDVDNLYAFEAVLTYDADKLELQGAEAALEGSSGFAVGPLKEGNKATFAYTKTGNAEMEAGSVTLGFFTFRAKQAGDARIEVKQIAFVDRNAKSVTYVLDRPIMVSVARPVVNDEDDDEAGAPGSVQPAPANSEAMAIKPAADGYAHVTIEVAPALTDDAARASLTASDISAALNLAVAEEGGRKRVDIRIGAIAEADRYTLQLPATVLQAESDNNVYRVETPVAELIIPGRMLAATALDGEETIELGVSRAGTEQLDERLRSQIGDRPVIELQVMAGGKVIPWRDPNAPITVSVPYSPTEEELQNPEYIAVWYIDGEGNIATIPSGRYDPETGKVTFTITHFSHYAVAFVISTFDDIAGYAWAEHPIRVLAAKGIMDAAAGGSFHPRMEVTRIEFVAALVRLLALHADVTAEFGDVPPTDAGYSAVGIARALGITAGTGANRFSPKAPITRQDMMVMTVRALRSAGVLQSVATGKAKPLEAYADYRQISDYAADDISLLLRSGLIRGKGDTINPQDVLTRAELAVPLYGIYHQ